MGNTWNLNVYALCLERQIAAVGVHQHQFTVLLHILQVLRRLQNSFKQHPVQETKWFKCFYLFNNSAANVQSCFDNFKKLFYSRNLAILLNLFCSVFNFCSQHTCILKASEIYKKRKGIREEKRRIEYDEAKRSLELTYFRFN